MLAGFGQALSLSNFITPILNLDVLSRECVNIKFMKICLNKLSGLVCEFGIVSVSVAQN